MPPSPAVFVGAFADPKTLPLRDREAVLVCVGRSNVGKSTFINALAGQDISRTSATPGRTRTANLFRLGDGRALVDLPGYGYAKQAKTERERLETLIHETLLALKERAQLKILLICDATVGLTALDEEMLAFLRAERLAFAIAANKADRFNQRERAAQEKAFATHVQPGEPLFFCSAKAESGLAGLRAWLAA